MLKLKVAPFVFARLFEELRKDKNSLQITEKRDTGDELGSRVEKRVVNFVRILPGERKFDGNEVEMTLEMTDRFPDVIDGQSVATNVSREMVDQLFDILEIFPRENRSQTTLGEVREPLRFILKNLEAIHDAAKKKVGYGEPESPTFGEISELARTAIIRTAVLQLIE